MSDEQSCQASKPGLHTTPGQDPQGRQACTPDGSADRLRILVDAKRQRERGWEWFHSPRIRMSFLARIVLQNELDREAEICYSNHKIGTRGNQLAAERRKQA